MKYIVRARCYSCGELNRSAPTSMPVVMVFDEGHSGCPQDADHATTLEVMEVEEEVQRGEDQE